MALVVIIIRDRLDGSASVELNAEPIVDENTKEFTTAQQLGAAALNAIHSQLHDQQGGIRIFGADEMPH